MAPWLTPTPSDQPQQVEPGDNSRHSPCMAVPRVGPMGSPVRPSHRKARYPTATRNRGVGQDPERRCHGHAPNGGLAFPAVNDVRIVPRSRPGYRTGEIRESSLSSNLVYCFKLYLTKFSKYRESVSVRVAFCQSSRYHVGWFHGIKPTLYTWWTSLRAMASSASGA